MNKYLLTKIIQGWIDFKDLLEIAQHPIVCIDLILKIVWREIMAIAEALISIDKRGFIFGSAISF